jgi:hypothetical protein
MCGFMGPQCPCYLTSHSEAETLLLPGQTAHHDDCPNAKRLSKLVGLLLNLLSQFSSGCQDYGIRALQHKSDTNVLQVKSLRKGVPHIRGQSTRSGPSTWGHQSINVTTVCCHHNISICMPSTLHKTLPPKSLNWCSALRKQAINEITTSSESNLKSYRMLSK